MISFIFTEFDPWSSWFLGSVLSHKMMLFPSYYIEAKLFANMG
jgi:hypothetical protein